MVTISQGNEESHKKAIEEMSKFFESEKPQLGIFWFNPNNHSLFGISKMDADLCVQEGHHTYPKLHKTYWQKQHFRARSKEDKDSIFYAEHNYTMIPRGKIFLEDDKFKVRVGDWINDLDQERFKELIQDEFNLPDNFIFEIDRHWNLGHGWGEEIF